MQGRGGNAYECVSGGGWWEDRRRRQIHYENVFQVRDPFVF